jgi:hypothetical protein
LVNKAPDILTFADEVGAADARPASQIEPTKYACFHDDATYTGPQEVA